MCDLVSDTSSDDDDRVPDLINEFGNIVVNEAAYVKVYGDIKYSEFPKSCDWGFLRSSDDQTMRRSDGVLVTNKFSLEGCRIPNVTRSHGITYGTGENS